MPLENTDAEERITRETMIGWNDLASEEPRIPFIVESEATAADTDEPPLDELITAATHEYLDSGKIGRAHV